MICNFILYFSKDYITLFIHFSIVFILHLYLSNYNIDNTSSNHCKSSAAVNIEYYFPNYFGKCDITYTYAEKHFQFPVVCAKIHQGIVYVQRCIGRIAICRVDRLLRTARKSIEKCSRE